MNPLQWLCLGVALACGTALLVLPSPAKAGPLDQGPHILVGQGHNGPLVSIAAFSDKRECLAVRDDLYRQLAEFNSSRPRYTFLACIPGRST